MFAAVVGVAPVALFIGVAADIRGVDEGAAETAVGGRKRSVPRAHGVVHAGEGNGVSGADGFAAETVGIPSAVQVGVAAILGDVAEAALVLADTVVNFALGEVSTSSIEGVVVGEVDGSEASASFDAHCLGNVPFAVDVGVARVLSRVAHSAGAAAGIRSGALELAGGGVDGVCPFASRVGLAVGLVEVFFAAAFASRSGGEPIAADVAQAVGGGEESLATRTASGCLSVEEAERILVAAVHVVVLDAASDDTSVVVPLAEVVCEASLLGGELRAVAATFARAVTPDALSSAEGDAVVGVEVGGVAGLDASGRGGGPAAEIGDFTALGVVGVLSAVSLASSLGDTPQAARIGIASGGLGVKNVATEHAL